MSNVAVDKMGISDFYPSVNWEVFTRQKLDKTNAVIYEERAVINTITKKKFAFCKTQTAQDSLLTATPYEDSIQQLRLEFVMKITQAPVYVTAFAVMMVILSFALVFQSIFEAPPKSKIPYIFAKPLNVCKNIGKVIILPVVLGAFTLNLVYGVFKPLDAYNFQYSCLRIYNLEGFLSVTAFDNIIRPIKEQSTTDNLETIGEYTIKTKSIDTQINTSTETTTVPSAPILVADC